ncbi:hypothetical protein B0H67DRAFT_267495 [Lasiosphaeris hirsuta]|uniref:Uncharacterized protein n=1 Tax=Lasiosphaeris hirsuta TaxID=260670 RepID=A0AA40DT13_9PEZI|nr:hypothetical protein B0H67DRAFT_267495 [Lasiosphaeris hirsuta]
MESSTCSGWRRARGRVHTYIVFFLDRSCRQNTYEISHAGSTNLSWPISNVRLPCRRSEYPYHSSMQGSQLSTRNQPRNGRSKRHTTTPGEKVRSPAIPRDDTHAVIERLDPRDSSVSTAARMAHIDRDADCLPYLLSLTSEVARCDVCMLKPNFFFTAPPPSSHDRVPRCMHQAKSGESGDMVHGVAAESCQQSATTKQYGAWGASKD